MATVFKTRLGHVFFFSSLSLYMLGHLLVSMCIIPYFIRKGVIVLHRGWVETRQAATVCHAKVGWRGRERRRGGGGNWFIVTLVCVWNETHKRHRDSKKTRWLLCAMCTVYVTLNIHTDFREWPRFAPTPPCTSSLHIKLS